MFWSVFVTLASAVTDRRLDPFQFNLCLWNLEGFDLAYPYVRRLRADVPDSQDDADLIAKTMYTSLSTCDMFLLPGLRNVTRANDMITAMKNNDFTGFDYYPTTDITHDVTILSRIDLDDPTPVTQDDLAYPIENSKCNCKSQNLRALMNLSFYANVSFHDPVPATRVVAVRLKSTGDNDTECDCAWREAQAQLLCKRKIQWPAADHLYIAGSFEADLTESYADILRDCGLTELSGLASGEKFSRKLKGKGNRPVLWDTIWVNEAVVKSGYLDVMQFETGLASVQDMTLTDYTYPIMLYIHFPLTARWKVFEIAFTSVALPIAIAYFVWLLIYAKPKEGESNYAAP
jgi:hypothetical protein